VRITRSNPSPDGKKEKVTSNLRLKEEDHIKISPIVEKIAAKDNKTTKARKAKAKKVTEEKEKPLSTQEIEQAKSWIIYKDERLIALNKPYDLAVQGLLSVVLCCVV
jgi:23S rRNA-/tRNA-specific pseudouridylate synthase